MSQLQTHQYRYKPNLYFFALEDENLSTTPTYGFELEIQYGDSNESQVCELLNHIFPLEYMEHEIIYLKHDSSIGNGIEIVSQPMTFKFFKANQNYFETMINQLSEMGCTSHKGGACGLHFHIGNNYFEQINLPYLQNIHCGESKKKELQLVFVASNMNRIMNHFQNNLIVFSRRTQSQINRWCQFGSYINTVTNNEKEIRKDLKKGAYGYRYKALNTTNENTLEIRILRGTLNFKTFYLSINFINNLTKASLCDNRCISWNDLMYDSLDSDYKEYAKKYMEFQLSQPKYSDIILEKNCIYTQKNRVVAREKCDMALKRLGIL